MSLFWPFWKHFIVWLVVWYEYFVHFLMLQLQLNWANSAPCQFTLRYGCDKKFTFHGIALWMFSSKSLYPSPSVIFLSFLLSTTLSFSSIALLLCVSPVSLHRPPCLCVLALLILSLPFVSLSLSSLHTHMLSLGFSRLFPKHKHFFFHPIIVISFSLDLHHQPSREPHKTLFTVSSQSALWKRSLYF